MFLPSTNIRACRSFFISAWGGVWCSLPNLFMHVLIRQPWFAFWQKGFSIRAEPISLPTTSVRIFTPSGTYLFCWVRRLTGRQCCSSSRPDRLFDVLSGNVVMVSSSFVSPILYIYCVAAFNPSVLTKPISAFRFFFAKSRGAL